MQKMQQALIARLREAGVPDQLVEAVVDSGYFLKPWMSGGASPHLSVSDSFYGNKKLSSSFEVDDFVAYIRGEHAPEPAPPLRRYKVRNLKEIRQVLAKQPLARYIEEGSLTFRGQPCEYKVRRPVPNPVRRDAEGWEISMMPGLYRQAGRVYSCSIKHEEAFTLAEFTADFEPDGAFSPYCSRDLLVTEQHYATQTAGLDVAFSDSSALFFATHQLRWDNDGRAFFQLIPRGEHTGVIYMFRLGMPSVRRTEYLIRDFDFFRIYRPERVIRQHCGLPYFSPYERNVALTEVDGVIELDGDFDAGDELTPKFMFPNTAEDPFYRRLLVLKDLYPTKLENVVEYQWARSAAVTSP
jgi:hypothetical protein